MENRQLRVVLAAIVFAALGFGGGMLFMMVTAPHNDPSLRETYLALARDPAIDLAALLAPTVTLDQAIIIDAGTAIHPIVEAAPAGSTFVLGAGIHRLQTITPRDGDTFIGAEGAIMNGSIVLDTITREGAVWIVQHPRLANLEALPGGVCREGFSRCNHPYDLYVDDVPLIQAESMEAIRDDTWFFDYDANQIVLGFMPDAGQTLELSVVFHAFQGEAANVTIQNLTIEKYGGFGQQGAIRAQDTTGWLLVDTIVRLNSGAGVTFGQGMTVLNNVITRNGQIGLSGQGDDVFVSGNEISYNNYAQYEPAWEAGGTKFVATNNLIVHNNYVHHNDGHGLWTDIDNRNTLYEYNLIEHNTGAGILHEISYDAIIRRNVARYNQNREDSTSVYGGAQIMLSSSGNVEISDNDVVAGEQGGNGIVIVQQDRGDGQYGVYEARNNRVAGNRIVYLNTTGESGAATDMPTADWLWDAVTFTDNMFYGAQPDLMLWGWQDRRVDWATFQAQTGSTGSYQTRIPVQAISSPSWGRLQRLWVERP